MDEPQTFGPFVLNRARRTLVRDGEAVVLTPKAFDILAVLVANAGQVVPKETILRTVWPDTVVDEGSLTFQVSTLRKALGDGGKAIVTVPGRGYQLALPVTVPLAGERLVEERVLVEERTTTVAVTEEEGSRPAIAISVAGLILLVAIVAWALTRERTDPRKPAATIRSLAVLPFKPLVAAERDEALEMGMADTLIAKISNVRGVTVRPLSAVRRFGGVEQDPIEAGRALDVDAVLDGSIHNAASQVRVTVRLLRVADAAQLWSGQYDSAFANIFALHDSISASLVDELSFELSDAERARVQRGDTRNAEAYRAYLMGRWHAARPRHDRLLKAIGFYEEAIALDPGYARAWSGLADVYCAMMIGADLPSTPSSQAARSAANQAIALDPGLAGARSALGFEKFLYEWDWSGAEQELRRALAIDPSDSDVRRRYAHLLSNTGRHAEALREADESLRLDPLSFLGNALRGQFLLHAGDVDAAIAAEKRALEIDPDFYIAHSVLGKAYAQKGMNAEALEEFRLSYRSSGGATEPLGRTGHLLGTIGREREARAVLADLLKISKQRYVPPSNIAIVHAGLGEHAEAVRWLRQACTDRDVRLIFLNVDPAWNVLRDEPGFGAIERCVSLPEQRN